VVGFIIGEIKGEGFGLEQSGWIQVVGVHPRQMGVGIGRILAEKLFSFFKKRESGTSIPLCAGMPVICFPSSRLLVLTVPPLSILGNIWIEAFHLKGEFPGLGATNMKTCIAEKKCYGKAIFHLRGVREF